MLTNKGCLTLNPSHCVGCCCLSYGSSQWRAMPVTSCRFPQCSSSSAVSSYIFFLWKHKNKADSGIHAGWSDDTIRCQYLNTDSGTRAGLSDDTISCQYLTTGSGTRAGWPDDAISWSVPQCSQVKGAKTSIGEWVSTSNSKHLSPTFVSEAVRLPYILPPTPLSNFLPVYFLNQCVCQFSMSAFLTAH